MNDLIEALTILRKYHNGTDGPTHCEHDELRVFGIDTESVSLDDRARLGQLGFFQDESEGGPCFSSYRFGSC